MSSLAVLNDNGLKLSSFIEHFSKMQREQFDAMSQKQQRELLLKYLEIRSTYRSKKLANDDLKRALDAITFDDVKKEINNG
jgi:hypothetical protein